MQKLLTIVVPSYNAEKYLRYNLDSLCQKEILDELEIIAVDDGSKDQTAEIIDEYARKYPGTVIPVHKENGGHGSGVNAGIRHATGKYFRVIDADDWADREELKELIRYIGNVTCSKDAKDSLPHKTDTEDAKGSLQHKTGSRDVKDSSVSEVTDSTEIDAKSSSEKKEANVNIDSVCEIPAGEVPDIIAGGFYWVYGHDESAQMESEFEKPFDGVEYGKIYKFDDVAEKAYIKMHSMTIRTEILKEHGIRIDEHRYYVDNEYILYPIPYVETVVFLDNHLYRYSISREGQSMNPKQMMKNKIQYDGVLESLYRFYDKAIKMESVSEKKRIYIEHLIARVYASRIKILLWEKISSETRRELMEMDRTLAAKYPGIYKNNINTAVRLIRQSGYWLYYPAAVMKQIMK